ncbi:high mobility group protein B1-like [Odontomachus brunneus]|uniref:high mobility group protein B1-like n=1 Tax=Odontomachus brunneus TaxID=486640 RepID=UPI0013F252BA|nr:high mobility group protein B1-like [Odontomachus brunneus]
MEKLAADRSSRGNLSSLKRRSACEEMTSGKKKRLYLSVLTRWMNPQEPRRKYSASAMRHKLHRNRTRGREKMSSLILWVCNEIADKVPVAVQLGNEFIPSPVSSSTEQEDDDSDDEDEEEEEEEEGEEDEDEDDDENDD